MPIFCSEHTKTQVDLLLALAANEACIRSDVAMIAFTIEVIGKITGETVPFEIRELVKEREAKRVYVKAFEAVRDF